MRSSTRNTLTPRECQVAALAALGLTYGEIADRLFVSTNTVKTHLHRVYEKTGSRNRLDLEHWLAENTSLS
ncbi:MAG TPA: helix-turn-helix transcriptional regulator [Dehalococcoidia bacterium]|nr:helix-turn-helix transcriptional regulator [Dehalococcoidia bacterium]